jgi:hypothetical protein
VLNRFAVSSGTPGAGHADAHRRGADEAGIERERRDPMGLQLLGKCLGPLGQGGLRGAVGAHLGQSIEAGAAGDIHDPPSLARDHAGQHRARTAERPQAEDSGIVHQDVDAAEA